MRKELGTLKLEGTTFADWRPNFSGRATELTPAGRRTASIKILDPALAEALLNDGWNVKKRSDANGEDILYYYLNVNINYDSAYPPQIYMVTSKNKTLLDEDTVGQLDVAEVLSVDTIIRPYIWEKAGHSGVSAYVKSMYVNVVEDELAEKYNN